MLCLLPTGHPTEGLCWPWPAHPSPGLRCGVGSRPLPGAVLAQVKQQTSRVPSHSPILLVQLVLPSQRAVLQDAVIPNHQPAGHGAVHLRSQTPQEGGQIFHRHRLAGESRGQLDTGRVREPCAGTRQPREQRVSPGAGGTEPLQEAGSGGRRQVGCGCCSHSACSQC